MIDRPPIRTWTGCSREEQILINRAWVGDYLRNRAAARRALRNAGRPIPKDMVAGRRMHTEYSRRRRARRSRD